MATPKPPEQAETIRFLARPSAYPDDGGAVRRIDTHGAIVFLTGERAYKLKRSVRFPYMDLSTTAKRLAACRAEVELNRRTAPEMYLGVAAVLAGKGGLVLGPLREPDSIPGRELARARDWVVVMKRFAAAAVYDRIAARNGLDAHEAEAIAEAVARFHAARPPVTAASARRSLKWVINGNKEELARHPSLFAPAAVRAWGRRADTILTAVGPLLAERRRRGYVRHLHGDLHLRNICRIDGRPVLFDALEFDPRLATTDVLYDLAFLLMDLVQRGLGDAANRLLNHYLALSVEPKHPVALKGLAALPLFMSARAAIRAHVEAAAADAQVRAAEARAHRVTARAYLRLAIRLLASRRPMLVAVGGLSGSGKTTLARALAPDLGAVPGALVLRSDVIRKRLAGVDPLARLPASAYGPASSRAVYQAMGRAAVTALSAGHAVIADAVFAREGERRAIAGVAARLKIPFMGLWLDAPRTVMAARLDARRNDASDATARVLDQQFDYDLGALTWSPIDAAAGAASVARCARRMLRNRR
jgi:hypothetical protein